ncbi:hypothetical protein FH608_046060 [Nonomuraea phyllanthi]|uniref:Uncharacterized protein n=1 Tax=Nonomuraea phyllanthi TaxID=2219224 RepID=A0A5C4V5P4_9ACTN|nr:hypothetical protein [Nonomuraea phyllanthi]KAB8186861.1 hypothetical protein FH608_046060 [Nonomuraea phyllanthi]
MTSTRPSAIADIIGQVKRPEKTVQICLAGDLQAEFEDLERDLQIARDQPAEGTLAGGANPMATQIAQQIMELRERMREHTTVFKFRGLPRKQYSDLVASCPPSDEDKEKGAEVDWEQFSVALVAACAVEPTMTADEAGQIADVLTQAQWDSLVGAAFSVNKRDVDVPFSFAASAILQNSRKNSK